MAKSIGYGLQTVDPSDLVKDGDEVISGNAVATFQEIQEARGRLGQLEISAGFDNGLRATDDAVAPLVRDAGTRTGAALDAELDSRESAFRSGLTAPGSSVDVFVSEKIRNEESGDPVEMALTPAKVSGTVGARLTIPTHVSPAGGQTTHPSIVFAPEGWNGYTYWLAHTPYPGGNDSHEDPNIAASNDGITWVEPAGITNPIDDQPGSPLYNSDVDLQFGPGGKLYLFWRTFDGNATGAEESLYYSTSSNGTTWAAKRLVYRSAQSVRRLLSPAFHFDGKRWTMWAVDIAPAPNRLVRLFSTGEAPESWTTPEVCNIGTMQTGKEAWHISVIRHGGRYVAILNDCTQDVSGTNGDMIFMISADGLNWQNSGGPIIPRFQSGEHDAIYRAAIVPSVQDGLMGYRVWYSAWRTTSPAVWNVYRTWIGERPTGGGSSKASASGQFNPSSNIAASGGFLSMPVAFPAGRFSSPPTVHVETNSTRLNLGINNVTASGFDLLMNNWTSSQVGTSSLLFWSATEK